MKGISDTDLEVIEAETEAAILENRREKLRFMRAAKGDEREEIRKIYCEKARLILFKMAVRIREKGGAF